MSGSGSMNFVVDLNLVGDLTIALPINETNSGDIFVTINWGDSSSSQTYTTANPTYTYSALAVYTINVSGRFTHLTTDVTNGTYRSSLVSFTYLSQIRDLTNFSNAFKDITRNPTLDFGLNLTNNVTNMSFMFNNAYSFDSDISTLDTSSVTNMRSMFNNASYFNQLVDNFDTHLVTDMESMFFVASSFNQSLRRNGNYWNTSNVQYGNGIFGAASAFNGDVTNWNTSNMKIMNNMFADTNFNQDIGSWNISNLVNNFQYGLGAYGMLNSSSLSNENYSNILIGWASQAPNINQGVTLTASYSYYTYRAVAARNILTGTYNWSITDLGEIPTNIEFVVTLTSDLTITLPIQGSVNVSIEWGDGTALDYTTNNPSYTYSAAGTYIIRVGGTFTHLSTSGTNGTYRTSVLNFTYLSQISALTNFSSAFAGITTNPTLEFGVNLTNNVTNMSGMFSGTSTFNKSLSTLNTSNVTNMAQMFYYAGAFNHPSVDSFDVSNVGSFYQMFGDNPVFNQSLNSWNLKTTPVGIGMDNMFNFASSFNGNISSWNTVAVTNMASMFQNASNFNQPIGNWNTSNVQNMSYMFFPQSNFNQDLSNWSIASLQNATAMFNQSGLSSDNYNKLLVGWAAQATIQPNVAFGALTTSGGVTTGIYYTTFAARNARSVLTGTYNWTITDGGFNFPCFLKGTKIKIFKNESEIYQKIEELKVGDLVKTLNNGYVAISMIGKKDIYHPASKDRIKEQLYKCTHREYHEVFEDLILTGCHSILIDEYISNEERDRTIEVNGDTYVTDGKYRIPACADGRTKVYEVAGTHTIYHFALENNDYYHNYGVYANGLLVETSSKRYLKELSDMELI